MNCPVRDGIVDPMHCYRCGRLIDTKATHLRRRVAVGEWVTKRYGRGGAASQVQKHGMRVVCVPCARRIDATPRIREVKQWTIIGFLLTLLAVLSGISVGLFGS